MEAAKGFKGLKGSAKPKRQTHTQHTQGWGEKHAREAAGMGAWATRRVSYSALALPDLMTP